MTKPEREGIRRQFFNLSK